MTTRPSTIRPSTTRARRAGPLLAFVGLCYIPLLITSPGKVLADTKSYLYLDPDRLLGRAWSMWDSHVAMGTVTHQNIGFLWPMGPYYWLMEHLGSPDWVAERLWLASIIFLAGLGVRYLLRTLGWRGPGVAVAMCAYALSPYLLTISVRISAILLPFVALPWLIGLTIRAIRTGSWRHPALFALIVTSAGSSNATSILLVGIGPALWVLWSLVAGEATIRRTTAAIARIGGLSLLTNAWWIVGLSVQATNGIDVLRYTESVAVTAADSSAPEVLRGLGYWFFYGDDARGPWVGPSVPFQTSTWLLLATFAVPVLALGGGALARWRERSFAILLLVVGLTLAVGVYPYADPSAFGQALRAFLQSDVGMAMRSMPRAAPLVVLALAVMLGAGAQALTQRLPSATLPVSALAIGLVVLSLPPLWQRTLVPENLSRPEGIPQYWADATAYLGATDDGTRVLELPGTDFTSYRWGTTLDPVTPGLTDRPMVARELVPMGSAPAWNLLKAFDGRLQANLGETTTVAAVARMMRAGQILVRSDLRYEQYDTPRPRLLWHLLQRSPGLGVPVGFGARTPNVAQPPAPMLDELALSAARDLPDPHPITVVPVQGPLPIVTVKSTAAPLVVAGDGEGLVDAAAAGLLDGTELLRYSATMTDAEMRAALRDGAVLLVTDTNRRRAERWGTVRFTNGYTEPAGLVPLAVDRSDARLPVFPLATDDMRTVALHRGGISANATAYGGRNEYLPEDRPANAVDGDPTTAWRTAENDPVVGQRLEVTLAQPVTTSTLTFLAPPPPINRWVTRAALRFDGGPPLVVNLDDLSHAGAGQSVHVGAQTFSRLSIEVLADTVGPRPRYGGLTSTGFAEVSIAGRRLDEVVRPPVDLLARAGLASADHPLAFVLTRLRSAITDVERLDEEPTLRRALTLPTDRSFALGGTVRLAPRASDDLLNRTLDPGALTRVTSSSRVAGAGSRSHAALDGRSDTAWTAAYGDQAGQWIEVDRPQPVTVDHLDLTVVADGRHSVPTAVAIEANGARVATIAVPPIADRSSVGITSRVTLRFPAIARASRVRVVIDAVRAVQTTDFGTRRVRTLPVAVAELGGLGPTVAAPPVTFTSGCRDDLLTIDGSPQPLLVQGSSEAAVAGEPLSVTTCDGQPVDLTSGSHDLRSTAGAVSGLDLDRLVLRSAPQGEALPHSASAPLRGASPTAAPAPTVAVTHRSPYSLSLRVYGAVVGSPFWLSFGEGWNDGWQATASGHDLGAPTLIDAYANGWQIRPAATTVDVMLRFTPQQRVNIALWASLVGSIGCLALALRRPRRASSVPVGAPEPLTAEAVAGPSHPPLPPGATVAIALTMGLVGAAVATPAVGVLVGGLALITARGIAPRWTTALLAPAAMAASGAYVVLAVARHHIAPGLEWVGELHRAHPVAWFAVLALATDAVVVAVRGIRRR